MTIFTGRFGQSSPCAAVAVKEWAAIADPPPKPNSLREIIQTLLSRYGASGATPARIFNEGTHLRKSRDVESLLLTPLTGILPLRAILSLGLPTFGMPSKAAEQQILEYWMRVTAVS